MANEQITTQHKITYVVFKLHTKLIISWRAGPLLPANVSEPCLNIAFMSRSADSILHCGSLLGWLAF